jgi:LytS/YehU family sensor histidine kinase
MTAGVPAAQFIYDALRKVAVAHGTTPDGQTCVVEIRSRHDDDSMTVVLRDPNGTERTLTLTEADFAFGDGTVSVAGTTLSMTPLYMKKLRGFTRGNIPTPDIAGPSLP